MLNRLGCRMVVLALLCGVWSCAGSRAALDARYAGRLPQSRPVTDVARIVTPGGRPVSAAKQETAADLRQPETVEQAAPAPIAVASHAQADVPVVEPSATIVPADVPEPPSTTGTPVLRLADLERLALASNPTISQLSASAHKAIGIRDQVGSYANPTVGYQAMQLADRGTDQHVLFFEQEIVMGDKLGLNRRVLDQSVQAQLWDVQAQRYRVLTDVRVRFYEALVAQREIELTTAFQNVTRHGVDLAMQRKQALEASQIEVLQAQIQLNEIDLTRRQAELAFRGAWQDLVAVAGVPTMQPMPLESDLRTVRENVDWDGLYYSMVSGSPELAAARAKVCEAQANLQRQEVQAIPNISVQLGAGVDNGTDSSMVNLQVGAPLPLYNKNNGNISAAHAEYCRATHEVKRLEMSIKSRLARASQEFDTAQATVQQYENEILPKAQSTLDLSEQAYAAGELDFLQVLIVRRTFFESNLKYVQALGQLAQANARLDGLLLSGALDAPGDFTGDDALRGQTFDGQ